MYRSDGRALDEQLSCRAFSLFMSWYGDTPPGKISVNDYLSGTNVTMLYKSSVSNIPSYLLLKYSFIPMKTNGRDQSGLKSPVTLHFLSSFR